MSEVKQPDSERFYQRVILILADGREVSYTGPVQVLESSELVEVRHVSMTKPLPLPKHWSFEEVGA